ncbi:unnamed protein product [Danaus chrysippus]|uniref:(African queen) hypothetical protein n=1 Tax=Danaus chrysippus TaxID=151541 RepID=A0A8J2R248_9NEOP|nr:unnamed protein product [Danaus chrysippus]
MGKRKSDLSRQTRRARRAKIRAQRIAAERKKVAWLKSVETFMQLQENMKDDSELKPLSIKEELSMHSSNDNFSSLKKDPLSEIKETILQKQNGVENDDTEQSPPDLLKVLRVSPYRKNILKV